MKVAICRCHFLLFTNRMILLCKFHKFYTLFSKTYFAYPSQFTVSRSPKGIPMGGCLRHTVYCLLFTDYRLMLTTPSHAIFLYLQVARDIKATAIVEMAAKSPEISLNVDPFNRIMRITRIKYARGLT
jgi:hypothetical protein